MANSEQPIDFTYAIPSLPEWQRQLVRLVEWIYGQRALYRIYRRFLAMNRNPETFWENAVRCLEIDIHVHHPAAVSVPEKGPLLVVANHPFGLIDGVAVACLVSRVRKDFKVIAWDVFSSPPGVAPYLLPLDLSGDSREARRQNVAVRRESTRWLNDGHCIVLFPAGMAAMSPSLLSAPEEMPWGRFGAKLIRQTGAEVLPMFVHGQNSRLFHAAGHLGYFFRLALFFRETSRNLGKPVHVHMSPPVAADEILALQSESDQMNWLRNLTLSMEGLPGWPARCRGASDIERSTDLSILPQET